MYLPFLRGKQFELLALRELASSSKSISNISPIIEPVKKDLKSIETAAKALASINVDIQLIVNPEQGDLKKEENGTIISSIIKLKAEGYNNITPTYIIGSERDYQFFHESANKNDFFNTGYSLVHLNQISNGSKLKEIANNSALEFNIIHVNHLFSLRRGYPPKSIAFLRDPFVKQKRNVDYVDVEDEFFSDDCFFYKSEGFVAFADYLTIGSEYMEGGMLPWAVVIHFTYKDKSSNNIRIKHFLSNSNLDSSDTAGKFGEALDKLVKFIDRENIHTNASEQFRAYYQNGAYPGLGVIKKLSIMHHIELIQDYI